jgi:lipoprotein-releasing system ATP-binding protein
MNDASAVLSGRDIHFTYDRGANALHVLKGVSLDLHAGELVAVMGPSGSGKSTLLHLLGLLARPERGSVFIGGQDPWKVNESRRSKIRNRSLGFVFQFHHLLEEFTVHENVAMPCMISGMSRKRAMETAGELLREVGIMDRARHFPSEVSGGERQRAALARALVMEPSVVLADEPTGNLDDEATSVVENLMLDLARRRNQAFLIATHSRELAQRCGRLLMLDRGLLREP